MGVRIARVIGCITTALATSLLAQQLPTFRANVDVVRVDVSVLDGSRRPMRGLAQQDFTILVDGGYLLSVEAGLDAKTASRRDVRFSVR